ncbi:MAG: hypothetical protein IJ335_09875 [Lachnospiraceae bacterium]|nr:hypothetical protein [Lachnospiraceae bacterium]
MKIHPRDSPNCSRREVGRSQAGAGWAAGARESRQKVAEAGGQGGA